MNTHEDPRERSIWMLAARDAHSTGVTVWGGEGYFTDLREAEDAARDASGIGRVVETVPLTRTDDSLRSAAFAWVVGVPGVSSMGEPTFTLVSTAVYAARNEADDVAVLHNLAARQREREWFGDSRGDEHARRVRHIVWLGDAEELSGWALRRGVPYARSLCVRRCFGGRRDCPSP